MAFQANQNMSAACKQCGTCCRKGGPALHTQDKALIEQGIISLKDLFTIRKHELIRDQIKGVLSPLDDEIIKIKGLGSRWQCCFLAQQGNDCTIYNNRPLECRVLFCNDPSGIEKVYALDRLRRKDLFAGIAGLWELVITHEEKCDYKTFAKQARRWRQDGNKSDLNKLVETIAYDRHLRRLVTEKMSQAAPMTDLLFGRPMTETIHMFGISAAWQNDQWHLGRTQQPNLKFEMPA